MDHILLFATLTIVSSTFAMNADDKVVPVISATQPCFTDGIFNLSLHNSLDNCAYECLLTSKCFGFSYHRQISACFLIDHNFNTSKARDDRTGCITIAVSQISMDMKTQVGICANQPCPNSSKCSPNVLQPDIYNCNVNECPLTAERDNAHVTSTMTSIGQTNTFKCEPGYTMFGNAKVTCGKNGVWSKSDFLCYPNCPEPKIANADVVESNPRFAYGTIAVFQCHAGYYNVTPLTVTCQETAQWSEAKCFKNCPEPENVSNAVYVGKTYSYVMDTTIEYKCNAGYYNITPLKASCNSNGDWLQESTFKCFKHCPTPPSLANAYFTSLESLSTIYTTIKYECNSGYYLENPSQSDITCLEDGVWTQPTAKCNKYCTTLPTTVDAVPLQVPPSPYTAGSVATYKCKSIFYYAVDKNSESFKCNENGDWIGSLNCCLIGFDWYPSRNKCCAEVLDNIMC